MTIIETRPVTDTDPTVAAGDRLTSPHWTGAAADSSNIRQCKFFMACSLWEASCEQQTRQRIRKFSARKTGTAANG